MPQTTDAVASACGKIEISTSADCAAPTDISGSVQSVSVAGQARMSGEVYTFDGDYAIIRTGKREPLELTFNIVYTDDNAEAFEIARGVFETIDCDSEICVIWSPAGGAVGDQEFTASGYLINFMYPPMDASSGDPIMCDFVIKAAKVTASVVSS